MTCGYSVAFVLQCFVPFFALVQAWLYFQIHRVVPNSGDGIGVFLIKKRDDSDALEVHVRTPKQGGKIVDPAYGDRRRYGGGGYGKNSGVGAHHVYRIARKPVGGAPVGGSRSQRGVPGTNYGQAGAGGGGRGGGRGGGGGGSAERMSATSRRESVERAAAQSETFGGGYGGEADDVSDDEYDGLYNKA